MGLDVIRYLEERVKVFLAHPGLFVVVLAIGLLGGLAWRGQEVANHDSLMKLKEAELVQLRERVQKSGEAVTEPTRAPSEDSGFTSDEMRQLRGLLSEKPSYIEITGLPNSARSKEITSLFSESGWNVEQSLPIFASNIDTVMLKWTDAATTATITEAFGNAGIKYELSEQSGEHVMTLRSKPVE